MSLQDTGRQLRGNLGIVSLRQFRDLAQNTARAGEPSDELERVNKCSLQRNKVHDVHDYAICEKIWNGVKCLYPDTIISLDCIRERALGK
jgi:hypothetical protein